MIDNKILNSFLFFVFCIYIYIAGFSYASFVIDDDFMSLISMYVRVFLIFVMLLVYNLNGKSDKFTLVLYFIVAILLLSFNPFFQIVAFMLIVGLIATKFIGERKAVVVANYFSLLSLFTILILFNLGYSRNYIYYDGSDFAQNVRYSLGFLNPNAISIFIAQIVFIFFITRNFFGIIVSLFFYSFILYFAASRTALVIFIVFLLFFYLFRNNYILNFAKFGAFLFILLFPLFVFLFVSSGIWSLGGLDLNQLLSGRLILIQEYYHMIGGISLFPSYNDFSLDSGFANILLKGGVVFYFVFTYMCYWYMKNEKDFSYSILFLVFLLLNLSENFITGNILFSVLVVARAIFLLKLNGKLGNKR
jgi:hypothetical protein